MRTAVRVVVVLLLAAALVWLLFTVVFPWVDGRLLNDPTLAGFA